MQAKWIMGLLAGAALAGVLGTPIRPVSAEDQPSIEEMLKNAKTPATWRSRRSTTSSQRTRRLRPRVTGLWRRPTKARRLQREW